MEDFWDQVTLDWDYAERIALTYLANALLGKD